MLKKGYIAAFAILLAVVGIGFVPSSVPNQEIVVQFSQETSSQESNAAIVQVKEQLLKLGIEDVKILEGENGALRISYYSDIDVLFVQEIFARQQVGLFKNTNNNNSDFPFKDTTDAYQFTVSEIGAGDASVNNGLKGHFLEIESKSHRFYPPEFFFTSLSNSIKKEIKLAELSELIYSEQAVVDTITSYLLPETRAGPVV